MYLFLVLSLKHFGVRGSQCPKFYYLFYFIFFFTLLAVISLLVCMQSDGSVLHSLVVTSLGPILPLCC
jgi:hypothetical protein